MNSKPFLIAACICSIMMIQFVEMKPLQETPSKQLQQGAAKKLQKSLSGTRPLNAIKKNFEAPQLPSGSSPAGFGMMMINQHAQFRKIDEKRKQEKAVAMKLRSTTMKPTTTINPLCIVASEQQQQPELGRNFNTFLTSNSWGGAPLGSSKGSIK